MSSVTTSRVGKTDGTKKVHASTNKPAHVAANAQCAVRGKPTHARSEYVRGRTRARPAQKGATMNYQQGFTSGPGA